MLENVGGRAVGGSDCATRPKASICSGCQYRCRGGGDGISGGIVEAISALGQARNKDCRYARHKEFLMKPVMYTEEKPAATFRDSH